MASVVLPESRMMLSPSWMAFTASCAMAFLASVRRLLRDSKERMRSFWLAMCTSPCVRNTRPDCSSSVRSLRMVAADTSNMAMRSCTSTDSRSWMIW